jgi:serine/threonine protein kinase
MIGSAERDHAQAVVSPEEWRRAKDVLTLAAGLAGRERTRLVEMRFPDEPRLRFELLSLLEVHDRIRDSLSPQQTAEFCALETQEAPTQPAAPPEQVIHIGKSYGPYRVIRLIGTGGMGQVYLAEDTRLGRRVALKSLAGSWLKSPTARQRLLHEARTAAALSHSHIATLYDVLEDEQHLLLVMEYVEGRTAAALVAEGPIPVEHALRLTIQICEALIYAHDRGFIHCDLKPSNIQVSPEDAAKVLDFGLACARYEHDAEFGARPGELLLVGTPAYMPPERFLNGALGVTGDVYSLGVTLFELLTGRLPFVERDFPALIGAIVRTTAPAVSSIRSESPARIDDVVARAMAKHPDERYQSAREFCDDLQDVLRTLDGASIATPLAAARPYSRSLLAAGLLAAMIVGLTFAGFITSNVYGSPLGLNISFEQESPLWWPVWGLRSLMLPIAQIGVALLGLAVMSQLLRAALSIKPLQHLYERVCAGNGKVLGWMQGVPVRDLAGCLLLAHVVVLTLFWWRFKYLFGSFDNLLHNSGSLAALSPEYAVEHRLYMRALSLLVLCIGWSWYRLWKMKLPVVKVMTPITVAAGVAVMLLTFLLMVGPYRLFFHSKGERVMYESHSCYLVGKNGNDAMLFCPTQERPWSKPVNLDDPALKHSGTRESIFSAVGDKVPKSQNIP